MYNFFFLYPQAVPPPISITGTPSGLTFALVGISTEWDGSTTFSVVGGAGAEITAQAVSDFTHASITITTHGDEGPYIITDGTTTFSLSGVGGLIIVRRIFQQ